MSGIRDCFVARGENFIARLDTSARQKKFSPLNCDVEAAASSLVWRDWNYVNQWHMRATSPMRREEKSSCSPPKTSTRVEKRRKKIYSIFHVATEANKRRRLFPSSSDEIFFSPILPLAYARQMCSFRGGFFPPSSPLPYVMAARKVSFFFLPEMSRFQLLCVAFAEISVSGKQDEEAIRMGRKKTNLELSILFSSNLRPPSHHDISSHT